MKKNGFTMVELIITIALLALVAIIIGTNMSGLQSKQTEKNYNSFVSRLESAACQFIEKKENAQQKKSCKTNPSTSNTNCIVTVENLINAGLIEEDLVDPSTNEVVAKTRRIRIMWNNGEQTCDYQE